MAGEGRLRGLPCVDPRPFGVGAEAFDTHYVVCNEVLGGIMRRTWCGERCPAVPKGGDDRCPIPIGERPWASSSPTAAPPSSVTTPMATTAPGPDTPSMDLPRRGGRRRAKLDEGEQDVFDLFG